MQSKHLAVVIIFALLVVTVLGCIGSSTSQTPGPAPDTPVSTSESNTTEMVLDQVNDQGWWDSWAHIQPQGRRRQSFVPKYPVLTTVEVNLLTVDPEEGGDSITMKIIQEDGRVLTSRSILVPEDFDGWLRFDISKRGMKVPQGKTLFIQLEDTGKTVFGWTYICSNPYPAGSMFYSDVSQNGDFLFKTWGVKETT
jgi:hypothetical protein